ncbi:hypothetical protein AB1Y20_000292 [Prymnesium parvum]|uniref:Uncharacterized protein n=1 Tax=Prymnesium parvum TaxID=97485 RepID=A0AB34K470_PRYPA
MAPKKKANPRTQYFQAIKEQKIESLRWCLRHGGITLRSEDDDGHTGIQLAAAGGFTSALEVMLEMINKGLGTQEDVEIADEEGRTPLMMAAYNGKFDAVRMLVILGKAKLDTKSDAGKTACDYARERRHEAVLAFLKDPKAWKPPAEEVEEEDEEEEAKKKIFKASQKLGTAVNKQEEVHRAKVEAAEALERDLAAVAVEKLEWPEIGVVIQETRRELSLKGKPPVAGPRGPIDPALWGCVCLYELRLELADKVLVELPSEVSRLHDLTTLIVSHNALRSLPESIGTLKKLKNFEAANNQLVELPQSFSLLKQLQVLDVTGNQLTSLSPIASLESLVAVKAGDNKLTELPLAFEALEHLATYAAPANQITTFERGLGCCQQLQMIDLAGNKITEVPIELGNLTVKKLQSVVLKGNPLRDARIRRFVEDDSPTLVKDLLNHVRKNGFKGEAPPSKGGGKKGKKGKNKASAQAEELEDDGEDNIAALLAAMGKGSDDEDDVEVS